MNRRIKLIRWTALGVLGALILLLTQSLAFAGVHYLFSYGQFGDTAQPVDINDHGVIVWTGFGDGVPGDASYVNDFVTGYGAFGCSYCGVRVTDINNAGDMLGTALKNGVYVPTIWLSGLPYDLTDPANAGLTFDYDPGPKYVNNFDLWSLDVLGLPDFFIPGLMWPPIDSIALTNAPGQFVFGYQVQAKSYGILTPVPEPATVALVVIGLAGLAFSRRR